MTRRTRERSLNLRKITLALLIAAWTPAFAAKAPFDLAGPTLKVLVTRAGVTLPISRTPNLATGDALAIQTDLPPGQAARYLLVVAFLRGATNPPPKTWFYAHKTWESGGHGVLTIKVPTGAQQALIFLAPHTVGDLDTLRAAVRARPGAFVRASQDLNQLGLDRGRLNTYLEAIRRTDQGDPAKLQAVSTALARTLGIKLDPTCFQKTPQLQAPCLMQDQDSLVLDDGQNGSVVKSLTSGASADLMTQLGYAPQVGGGAYSPYVGAVLDIARLLDSLGTAHFQYVPALAASHGDDLELRLNTAPSFGAVKSVLVAALPPVEPFEVPELHPTDGQLPYCLAAPQTTLSVEGAPLVFSTRFARDMRLRLKATDGETFDIPVRADAERGGFIADTSGLVAADFSPAIQGRLHGQWGFSSFEGPVFSFQTSPGVWRLAAVDQAALVAGRADPVTLSGGASACVKSVTLSGGSLPPANLDFKTPGPERITLTAPLSQAAPGAVTFVVQPFGPAPAQTLSAEVVAQASRVDRFDYHAGDGVGQLSGTGLNMVTNLTLGGAKFRPQAPDPASAPADERLSLMIDTPLALAGLTPGRKLLAKVALSDGRALKLPVTILASRPGVRLLAKSLSLPAADEGLAINLRGDNDIPSGAVLTFSVEAQAPADLAPIETVEVATADGAFSTNLAPGAGLTREDAHVAVATLDTATAFGSSAFGPLRFRLVDARGASDWVNLATLVRLPALTALKCPDGATGPCDLAGSKLFLIQAAASEPTFADAVQTPEGFPGDMLTVPHPHDGKLYLRLHDDPTAVGVVSLPIHRRRPKSAAGQTKG